MILARAAVLALLLAVLGSLLFPLAASAHPLGNFTVNRYSRVEIEPERVTLRYVLDLAEIPALQELNAAGISGIPDAAQRDVLIRRFATLVREGARLSVGGTAVPLTQRDASFDLVAGEAGLATMRVVLSWSADVRVGDGAPLRYEDTTFADRIGWREVVLRAGPGVRLDQATVPGDDQTDELRRYPADPLRPPLAVSAASAVIRLAPGEGGSAPVVPATGTARLGVDATGTARLGVEGLASGVSDLVRAGSNGDLAATLLALVAALGLGAFHALTPGHGKTVMAAYLVGTRGSARQALGLGAAVAVSHTLGVLLLGLLILGSASVIAPERTYPYLAAASALIVLGIGGWLLFGVVRSRAHDRAHAHGHSHDHAHSHDHDHAPAAPGWRALIALGVSGGIVPSASALLLLLAAVSLRRPDLGVLLIVAFGVGMAAVLVGIGLVLVRAGRLGATRLHDRSPLRRIAPLLPIGTAVVVLLIGIGLSVQAGQQLLATL